MRTYLTKQGEIRQLKHKDIGASWTDMNEAYVKYMTKEEGAFLEKYGLRPTIFNVANLRKFGVIHLPEGIIKTALEHGAMDRRLRKVI
jgi:hypothetical protein